MKSKWSIQKLIYTGMLAAIAGALMSLEFSVPLMPPFYKVDFSDVPSIMALFMFGPASAAWVEIIKILIKLITVGTNSMYVGELSNLIGVALFVLPLWAVYNKMGKSRKAAVTGLAASIVVRTAFACFCKELFALDTKIIEGTGQRKRFDIFLITCCQVDAFHKVEDIFIRTVFLPFLDDIQYGRFTYAFHGA